MKLMDTLQTCRTNGVHVLPVKVVHFMVNYSYIKQVGMVLILTVYHNVRTSFISNYLTKLSFCTPTCFSHLL
jgi:hypothetical protein